ncbi:hypothetical protein RRF57_009424 [Xylaria bambusicola]|uniref:Uncharacterized protein n=1 Tax=Xylaria bambusicola TaxID=326684 RepID=A0AAN7Z1M1_9PEZI
MEIRVEKEGGPAYRPSAASKSPTPSATPAPRPMFLHSLVAEVSTDADDSGKVTRDEGGAGVVAQVAEPLGQEVIGCAGLVGSGALLLGEVGLGAGGNGALLALFPLLLGLGLDILL